MEFNKRTRDVSQVFDSNWKANHNYQKVKNFHEDRRQHFNKMFGIQDKDERKKEILEAHSVNGQVKRLEENMRAADAGNRLEKSNNFRNNFR